MTAASHSHNLIPFHPHLSDLLKTTAPAKTPQPHDFNGAKLQFAREAAGLSRVELATEAQTSASFITACEKQKKKPSADLRTLLASKLGVKPRFFSGALDESWDVETCHFRHRQAASIAEKGQLRSELFVYSKILDALTKVVQFPRVALPDLAQTELPTESLAAELRRMWRMSANSPVGAICRVIERAGIVILFHSSDSERVDACSKFGSTPTILITKQNRGTSRVIYDLAHELGELVYRSASEKGVAHEKRINAFAGYFLMPRDGFGPHFCSKPLTLSHLLELKATWRVSMSAVLQHALSLRLLDQETFVIWKRKIGARGWTKSEPQEPQFSNPEAFRDAIALAISRGLTLRELSEFVDLEANTLHTLFKANGTVFPEIMNTVDDGRQINILGSRNSPTEFQLIQPSLLENLS